MLEVHMAYMPGNAELRLVRIEEIQYLTIPDISVSYRPHCRIHLRGGDTLDVLESITDVRASIEAWDRGEPATPSLALGTQS